MDRLIETAVLEDWIPIRLYWSDGRPMLDWCYLGKRRFAESFFEQTIGKCLQLPFNQLFRHQTPVDVLRQWNEVRPGLNPTGFIFHMSRCGSTLISQMLASLPQNIVISEARPIDSTLRAHFHCSTVTDNQRIEWLRWMVSAFAQRRGKEQHFFIKFDTWNVLEAPLIRRAFPTVPSFFVYRDPVEVLVSQLNHRGAQMVPGVIDPTLFGMNVQSIGAMEPEEYCARVLAAICQAGVEHHANGGLLINYRQLPEAVWTSISRFFGISISEAEMETMKGVAKFNAKNEAERFQYDSARKQESASGRLREAARRWLYPVYEELETRRLADSNAFAHEDSATLTAVNLV
jgi:Sulfotransferase domain